MAQKKQPFDLVLSKTAASGSNDTQSEPAESGELWCIQRLAAENQTTDFTELRILKTGGAGELLLAEQTGGLAATLYWVDQPFYLTEGQYIVARFTGCTASDILKVYLTGWKTQASELEV